jgi:hypothetical protein
MSEMQCPRCGKTVSELQNLDANLATKIQEANGGGGSPLPPQLCVDCFNEVAGSIARGSVVLAREKAKEQKKLMLWKSRVNLIKRARQFMNEKNYSDAAVQYEKYIKVLEVVFDCEAGDLSPEHFKDSARTQELTVVAGVYWDLMRIYDTSERYGERMQTAGKKLAQFLRYTPVFPDIVRKAEAFVKTAKNPGVVKNFLKGASEGKGRCFIATAAFASEEAPEVIELRYWRDQYLLKKSWGIVFVALYYRLSPPFAVVLERVPRLKAPVRAALREFINRAVRH